MTRRETFTGQLYRAVRDSANVRSFRSPSTAAKRVVWRAVYRREGTLTRRIFKIFGLWRLRRNPGSAHAATPTPNARTPHNTGPANRYHGDGLLVAVWSSGPGTARTPGAVAVRTEVPGATPFTRPAVRLARWHRVGLEADRHPPVRNNAG